MGPRFGPVVQRQRADPGWLGDILLATWRNDMAHQNHVTHSHPEILGGTPVFVGTRVPVRSLFDYIEGGETLDEFLRQFPSVNREQAIAALDLACDSLVADAHTA